MSLDYQLLMECREGLSAGGRSTGRDGLEWRESVWRIPCPLAPGPEQGLGIEGPRDEAVARKSLHVLFWPHSPMRKRQSPE